MTLFEDLIIICNEEGRLQQLPWCCEILGCNFIGTIILCGADGDEFADLGVDYQKMKKLFPRLWEEIA